MFKSVHTAETLWDLLFGSQEEIPWPKFREVMRVKEKLSHRQLRGLKRHVAEEGEGDLSSRIVKRKLFIEKLSSFKAFCRYNHRLSLALEKEHGNFFIVAECLATPFFVPTLELQFDSLQPGQYVAHFSNDEKSLFVIEAKTVDNQHKEFFIDFNEGKLQYKATEKQSHFNSLPLVIPELQSMQPFVRPDSPLDDEERQLYQYLKEKGKETEFESLVNKGIDTLERYLDELKFN